MTIYFLRHASAGKRYVNPKRDENRPLDETGILQARYIGRLLSNMDIQLDQIISSPLKRAMQTASLAANELAFETGIQTDAALRPESEYEAISGTACPIQPLRSHHGGWTQPEPE